jgi:hypothetical protein
VVIVAGLLIGSALRSDDGDDTASVTLQEGTLDGTDWREVAARDVEGSTGAFLYEGDDDAPLNGACDLTPQDVTYGDQTVVFGRAPADADTVAVVMEDGEVVEIATVTADGVDGRFYVEVVDGDVDAEALQ